MSRLMQKYLVEENGRPGEEVEAIDVLDLFAKLANRYTQASHLIDPLFDRGGQVRITRTG